MTRLKPTTPGKLKQTPLWLPDVSPAMAKKKKHPEHENLERWLVSYADFITLLFATFTALYAIATAEITKMTDVSKAISQSFEQQSLMHGIQSLFEGQSSSTDKTNLTVTETGKGDGVLGQHDSLTYTPGEVKEMEEVVSELQATVQKLNQDIESLNDTQEQAAGDEGNGSDSFIPIGGIEVSVQDRGLRISFDSRLLFAPGSAQLSPAAAKIVDQVARRIFHLAQRHQIHVEGHTDQHPLSSALYPSNWELSTARAATVVRRLIRLRFPPSHLVAVGYGDSRPIASNLSAEGRARNRRIDLILYSFHEGAMNNPTQQQRKEKSLIKAPAHTKETRPVADPSQVPAAGSTPSDPPVVLKDVLLKSEGSE